MYLSEAESAFDQILQDRGFLTAGLKESVRAPSLQAEPGRYIIIPDILAVDTKDWGWCFEVKDERESETSMRRLEMPGGYAGPVWFLEPWKAESYLKFSRAFKCPCILVVRGRNRWKLGFFTQNIHGKVGYNRDLVVRAGKTLSVILSCST